MYINDCKHTFEELANSVLPAHMKRLEQALLKRRPASEFSQDKIGPASLAARYGLECDFSGCYVLVEGEQPKYVGISRGVLSRLRQHLRGRTHFDAGLAYAIAQTKMPTLGGRNAAMKNESFQEAFRRAQEYLASLSVAFVAIDNPLELYLFEVYAAVALGTYEWNTFQTH